MSLPVNIIDLIHGRKVESPRIEYKKGWNPEKVLHTICAFANDIDDWGGGYIILGIDADSGLPEVVGLERSSLDNIQRELFSISNLIDPRYIPAVDISEIDGKAIMTIWVPTGDRRPYSCPVRLSKDRRNDENGYYIRKLSSTLRAQKDELRILFEISRHLSFDQCTSHDAVIENLRPSLISDYLYRVGSSMYSRATSEPLEQLCSDMRLLGGPREDPRPLNIGVMFFTDRPDVFIRGAFVDVVYKPDPTGKGMEESRFTGPIDRQIIDAMGMIERQFVKERVYKSDTKPEATRIRNYPMTAIRELLVNAVYHKSYEIAEPVTVTITESHIEFLNYPGPSKAVSDEDIRNNRLTVGTYRNNRMGEYLKELKLAESRFTGIPSVVRSLEENGSPDLKITTDPERSYFKATIGIHPIFLSSCRMTDDITDMEDRIVSILHQNGCMKMYDISIMLGYKGINNNVRRTVFDMMDRGIVEYLYPDKPRSPKQRICLSRREER